MERAAMKPSFVVTPHRSPSWVCAAAILVLNQGCYESYLAGDPLCTGETCSDVAVVQDAYEPEPPAPEAHAPACDDGVCMERCLSMGFPRGGCSDDHGCYCEQEPAGDEVCGDGVDNDRDGDVDEDCECMLGEIGACFTGLPENRGVGSCRDGASVCAGDSRSTHWGPCRGSVLPMPEICSDSVDNDCDGVTDIDDDDCCRLRDENCTNCVDDNCNGLVDLADGECESAEVPEGHCNCCVPGTWRWCDEIMYCAWGTQQCLPDGQWGACIETSERPAGCEGHVYDLACCFDSGACCQVSAFQPYSLGDCGGIVTPCTM